MKWWPKWLQLPKPEPPEALHEAEAVHARAEKTLREVKEKGRVSDQVVRDVRKLQKGDQFSRAMDTLFRGGHA